jgi:hypothetical protein
VPDREIDATITADAGPRCPSCGRAVHRLPDGRLFTPLFTADGVTLAPHVCLPRGFRYPVPAIREGPPREFDRIV